MDKFGDIIVNMLSIITLFFTLFLMKNKEKFYLHLLWYSLVALVFYYLVGEGYGNIFFIIIMQICFIYFYLYMFDFVKNNFNNILMKTFFVVCFLVHIYNMLLIIYIELNIKIESIDKLLDRIYSANYSAMLKTLLNNEYSKEITIGVLGTVIGGLILDKITKNKKGR